MSDGEDVKRKSTRTAAIEAAKRIKNNAHGNKLLSHVINQKYQFDEVHDSTVCPPKVRVKHDLSKKLTKTIKTSPSKSISMPKRGRGRPPKAQSGKYLLTSSTNSKYEDVDKRRESYNTYPLKNEPSSPKELQPGNGGITYRESLMKFCKDLGPTARKIAHRKLRNITQITFGDNKGKTIMVDDGQTNSNKWNTGVKICNGYQENVTLTGGTDGSSEYQDFFHKNLGHGPVINKMSSFFSNCDGNMNQNINNYGIEKVEENPWNGKLKSCVYPSKYVQSSRKVSSSIPWVPPVVPPLQKWCLPPPETKNPAINDGFWREQDVQLALASYMHMTDHNSKSWFRNSLAQNQFLQPQQHQVQSYLNMVDNDTSDQSHYGLLMPMAPQMWSQMAMFGSAPEQDSFSFGI